MILTIALVVLFAAIVVFFSQEFTNFFKKLASIPGVLLLVPLLIASWVVEVYEAWGHWFIIITEALLHQAAAGLSALLPFEKGALTVVYVSLLFLFAGMPVWLTQIKNIKKGGRKPELAYWIGAMLWIIGVILIVATLDKT